MRHLSCGIGLIGVLATLCGASRATASPDPLPLRIGACVKTTIATVGGRLEGDATFESGTAVRYANGGVQVSYDKVAALIAAHAGDAVRVCLVSVPRGCPPGDDRGRIYRAFDLRSHRGWTMPETQHSCGGA